MKTGKFRLGERVKANIDIKTDNPAIGVIIKCVRRLDRYVYRVKFDKPLFKKYYYEKVNELDINENNLTLVNKND